MSLKIIRNVETDTSLEKNKKPVESGHSREPRIWSLRQQHGPRTLGAVDDKQKVPRWDRRSWVAIISYSLTQAAEKGRFDHLSSPPVEDTEKEARSEGWRQQDRGEEESRQCPHVNLILSNPGRWQRRRDRHGACKSGPHVIQRCSPINAFLFFQAKCIASIWIWLDFHTPSPSPPARKTCTDFKMKRGKKTARQGSKFIAWL